MDEYNASQIQILEGLKAVRQTPGMYIGNTSEEGLHHMVYEVIDNSIDESMAGFCSNIYIIIYKDGSISVEDDGRGIPVDMHPKYKRPGLEIVLTELHSGAKFDKNVYKVTGGLHGVGVHVVNALSDYLEAIVKKNDKLYIEKFERGLPVTKMEELDYIMASTIKDVKIKLANHGTIIKFHPDPQIFDVRDFSYEIIAGRCRQLAFLNPQVTITVEDERTSKKETYHFTGGLSEFVKYISSNKDPVYKDPIYYSTEIEKEVHNEIRKYSLEFAFLYVTDSSKIVESFANNIRTIYDGTHVTGFYTGLSRAIIDYIKSKNLSKLNITGDDTRDGLIAAIHVKLMRPQFEGQTKEKLGNSEIKSIVASATEMYLKSYFESYPVTADAIAKRVILSAEIREASRSQKELIKRKSALSSGSSLPGKLADCSSDDPAKTELYIVEGDSAGGSAKQARNREFQAILPLRGKILNVEKAGDNKVLVNEEIKNLITAIGSGIKENFDEKKLRYDKIIIMTDADVDGAHIRTLLLTFFYRFMRPLIELGHVYFAEPPLYRIQKGTDINYVYTDDEKDRLLKKLGNATIQRFKGLGEMNPEQLWDTTMNPEKRRIVMVTIEDAMYADELFNILMGEKVEPRRKFIEENAKFVKNLDI
ncbi:DNA topoisomerase subunit B [Picrophilus oshimae]|uniref:DNA topoisomerase (ATP-hydrolyzing) n=1 Tax=Picrophilus torridus (strain ATCC 700027 / DSM 9790 / JCM 10055 / NBRC 100828 / KAW 2/3) TaxID=1122961 RepID=Q6KZ53_PICTO|nr:DNA topoisomerase subunit B [Picrophilus oshimae]AAT43999.1 DNA gyrase subunit B [Picrophilus oshimae DSM 9789]SMD30930.1 DNA gyrase subunit B [Picrophilus oshimae DSM 9789]